MKLSDLAQHAGVSVATVSRVLYQNAPVSESTRNTVLQAMVDLNIKPDDFSKRGKILSAKFILVICSHIINHFYDQILEGLQDVLEDNGYHLIICNTRYQVGVEREFLLSLKFGRIAGIIFLSSMLSDDELLNISKNFPVVQCVEYRENLSIPWISFDNISATKSILKHLMKIGKRKIVLLSCRRDLLMKRQREETYRSMMEDSPMGFNPRLIIHAEEYEITSGLRAVKQLILSGEQFDAIYAASDMLAMGAIYELHNNGMKIPEDVAVAGCDDLEVSSILNPPLTTIYIPKYDLGVNAAKILLKQLEDKEAVIQPILLEHNLRIRESTI